MPLTKAEQLLDRARSDPQGVLSLGPTYIDELAPDQFREQSISYRAMSIAARASATLEASVRYADKAHDAAVQADDSEQKWLALLTKSGSHAIAGESDRALEIVDEAIAGCEEPLLLARFVFQRGAIAMTAGRMEDAAGDFNEALPRFVKADDVPSTILTLHNLGRTLLQVGELDAAEKRMTEARRLAVDRSEWVTVAGLEQNLGRLYAYRGDIPEALKRLGESDRLTMEYSGAEAPQHVNRADLLLSVGRFTEALELAERIAEARKSLDDMEHYPEAVLSAARAALLSGRTGRAAELATEAVTSFDSQSRTAYRSEAQRVLIEARYLSETPSKELLSAALDVADSLEADGLETETRRARLLAGRIAIDLGDLSTARQMLSGLVDVRSGPVETVVGARVASASLARAAGDRRAAFTAARSGLRTVANYQTAIGASDLRLGVERHATDLARVGLELAIESGRPRQVLEWMEQTRARSLQYRPVVPATDEMVRGALTELRLVESELRQPQRRSDSDFLRRRRELQEQIRDRDRTKTAMGAATDRFAVESLIDELGQQTLVEIAEVAGQLYAVVVTAGRARLKSLGPAEALHTELTHFRFALRRASRLGRSIDMELVHRMDDFLLSGLGPFANPVVLCPPKTLMALPWSLLPTLAGVPLVVTPSAEIWWRRKSQHTKSRRVLLVSGPDLENAKSEIEAIRGIHPEAVAAPNSMVTDAVSALTDADIAHFTCHARFEHENPMFSSLRLADGNLNVYDIERLESVPSTVVLSACDSGYTEAKAGEELAGLTSALLSMGTRSVVASVGLVPDSEATCELMVRLHRGLAAGLEVPDALAAAQSSGGDSDPERIAAASFVAIGA